MLAPVRAETAYNTHRTGRLTRRHVPRPEQAASEDDMLFRRDKSSGDSQDTGKPERPEPAAPRELAPSPGFDHLFDAHDAPTASDLDKAEADKQTAIRMLDSGGDARVAVRMLSAAVEVSPDPDSLVVLAQVEQANPLWRQKALDRLKKAVAMSPRHTGAWLAIANYWGVRGDKDKQRRAMQKILAYDPNNHEVRDALDLLGPES
jgi:tetratricopeptide (TPR) repeat protein